jgi:hypothetical protein
MTYMEQDGTDNQTSCVPEIHPSLQLHGEAIVGEDGVEGPMVPVRTLHGKIGRGGISVMARGHKNHNILQTQLLLA